MNRRSGGNAQPQGGRDARDAGFQPSPFEWLCLLAGCLLVVQYAWLLDDAFVYFRYVDNLLFLGLGLVYNAGEYVEGYSSPLWILLLIAARSSEIGYWLIIRVVGVACFVVFWALTVDLNRRLSPRTAPIVNFPLVSLAFNYGLLCYFTSGTESPLVIVASVCIAQYVVRSRPSWIDVPVALAPLIRHELVIPLAGCILWRWARTREIPWRVIGISVAALGGLAIFRTWYYAEWLPNTFYLKNAFWPSQGWPYLLDTALTYPLPLITGLAALIAWLVAIRRAATSEATPWQIPERGVLLVMAALIALFVIKIGGDARHFRYLIFPFVVGTCALGGLTERVLERWSPGRRNAVAVAVSAAIAAITLSAYPRQLDRHPLRDGVVAETVDKITDAQTHRAHSVIPDLDPWQGGESIELLPRYRRALGDRDVIRYRGVISSYLCWKLYKNFDRRNVHTLGLTDSYLARTNLEGDWPAHNWALVLVGQEIETLIKQQPRKRPRRGMFRAAFLAGRAPAWVEPNLESLSILEQKIYNRHDFIDNLALALARPERIFFERSPLADAPKPRRQR